MRWRAGKCATFRHSVGAQLGAPFKKMGHKLRYGASDSDGETALKTPQKWRSNFEAWPAPRLHVVRRQSGFAGHAVLEVPPPPPLTSAHKNLPIQRFPAFWCVRDFSPPLPTSHGCAAKAAPAGWAPRHRRCAQRACGTPRMPKARASTSRPGRKWEVDYVLCHQPKSFDWPARGGGQHPWKVAPKNVLIEAMSRLDAICGICDR